MGQEISFVVLRDGARIRLEATPVLSEVRGRQIGRLGIVVTRSTIGRDRDGPLEGAARAAGAPGELTVAGGELGYRDGPASTARFDTPSGLAVDAGGGVLVADTGNNRIQKFEWPMMVTRGPSPVGDSDQ